MAASITRKISTNWVYDLLVVGGGVTGSAIAYDAASRGLSVLMVEKGDFGGATSAATGKLIHGGLRYLKNFEFALVREALRERRILSDIAPGLVEPIPMVLPEPGLIARAGLAVYDLLSFDRNRVRDSFHRLPPHRSLSRAEMQACDIGHFRDAVLYYDCMMPSPERLTLAFARSAAAHGADLLTYSVVNKLIVEQGRIIGAELEDLLTGEAHAPRARFAINATGPWAHDLMKGAEETRGAMGPAPAVRSEGLYLVTRQLSDVMVLFVTEQGHFSFAPWRGRSLIGPTETPYRGAVEDWRPTRRNIEDFLERINASSRLPHPLRYEDVEAVYGGLRPLTESSGESTYGASRASEMIDHRKSGVENLITAAGGKYTTSRAFAEKIVDAATKRLGLAAPASQTAEKPLDGCDIGPREDAIRTAQAVSPEMGAKTVSHLLRNYGEAWRELRALAEGRPDLAEPLNEDGEILAQAVYAIRHEAAVTLSDVALRRTGLGTLGDPGDAVLERLAATVAAEAGWSAEKTATELAKTRQAIRPPQ